MKAPGGSCQDTRDSDGESDTGQWHLILLTGSGRSGSTLLQRLLAQYADTSTVGEAVRVWDCAYPREELCGCGQLITQCPVWHPTLSHAGVTSIESAARMASTRDRMLRIPELARLLCRRPSKAMENYIARISRLYEAFANETGATVLVDSSKRPGYTILLTAAFPRRVSLVHLTRDPRAVAFSLQRQVKRRDVVKRVEFMPQYSASRSSLAWLRRNVLAELNTIIARSTHRLRYEDLVAEPSETLGGIRRSLGLPELEASFVNGSCARLTPRHSVAGNSSRFDNGVVKLKLDDEWTTALAPTARRAVEFLTMPLRHRYGYGE